MMQVIRTIAPNAHSYLCDSERAQIDHEISVLESRTAAGIEALKIVQASRGWISDESLAAIAQYLSMSTAELDGVATFYNLIYRQPVGKYVIHLCNSVSCHLNDYQAVLSAIQSHLGIKYGETTPDGMFTLLSNACLGGCDKAPVMMIGEHHYEHLSPNSVIDVLESLRATTKGA
ncbi:NADH-quinone oxidoreductase subunit NuoE [Thalassotalea fusca]